MAAVSYHGMYKVPNDLMKRILPSPYILFTLLYLAFLSAVIIWFPTAIKGIIGRHD